MTTNLPAPNPTAAATNDATMQAIISTQYGGPEVLQLQQVAKPQPKDHEILVRIHATSVTAAHTAMRTGYPLIGRLFMGLKKPKNPISGTDFAGEVVAVGKEVLTFQVGERVFGSTDVAGGTYAEYVCVPEDAVVFTIPENLTYEAATAIIDGATTAYPFLTQHGKLQAGQHILINGASGGIGTAAVQLAKMMGAEVTGVCSTRNVDLVRSLGADHVIDYTREDVTQQGIQYDLIFDTVGKIPFAIARKALTPVGSYLSPVLAFNMLLETIWTSLIRGQKAIFAATGLRKKEAKKEDFVILRDLLEQGVLRPVIDRTYRLPQIAEAHRYVDKGHKRGNVVIKVVE